MNMISVYASRGERQRRPRRHLIFPGWGALLCAAVLISCSGQGSERTARTEAVPVLAAAAVQKDMPVSLTAIGTVEPYRSVAVRARVSGELTAAHFREGDNVTKGALLFSIDSRPYGAALKAAQADLAEEKAKLAVAEADAGRYADLLARNLASAQQNDEAAAAADAERGAVQSLEADVESAQLNLDYCSIRAPISGRTGNLLIHEGNLIVANSSNTLVVINQLRPIYVSFSVPEGDLPEIRSRASRDSVWVEAAPPHWAGLPARGRLTFVNNAVDATTGTVLLKAEFANETEELWPGEFVNVTLVLSVRRDAVVVPAPAVQSGQKGDYVFIVREDQTVEMRTVTTGPSWQEEVIIESGVQNGETVVTDGQLRLLAGTRVVIKPSLDAAAGATAQ